MRYVLNKDNVELLCAALESGKFTKGKGVLHRIVRETIRHDILGTIEPGDYWCCLGVGSHIAAERGAQVSRHVWEAPEEKASVGAIEYFGSSQSDDQCYTLPWPVVDFYGFDSSNPSLCLDDGTIMSAANVNDEGWKGKDYSLPEIGALFRATYIDCDGPHDRQSKINANKESK